MSRDVHYHFFFLLRGVILFQANQKKLKVPRFMIRHHARLSILFGGDIMAKLVIQTVTLRQQSGFPEMRRGEESPDTLFVALRVRARRGEDKKVAANSRRS
jgi:hypothetical protein